jgi:eukaryotic-like serine/threonine-protein kinase
MDILGHNRVFPVAVNAANSSVHRFGPYEFEPHAGELCKQGIHIRLEGQPLAILTMLLDRPGELVTREELQRKLWPADTFVDFEHSLNAAIKRLRAALSDSASAPRYIETLQGRGYRFMAPVSTNDLSAPPAAAPSTAGADTSSRDWKIPVALATVAIVIIASGAFLRPKHPRFTEKDTIVLADFTNTTGETIFDDALKQGLRVQLEQSPFLNILSDEKVSEELQLMERPDDERLTEKVARQVCQRERGKAVLAGSISKLGSHYVIGLNALNCQSGDSLANEQVEVDSRERVLKALTQSATKMRERLGESLASIQRYDAPLEQVTTASLEALKAYSLGVKSRSTRGDTPAIPFFIRAVELDPAFAMAYSRLGTYYGNLGEAARSVENLRKAYELRDKVSERERFYIVSHYYHIGTGDWEKAVEVYELWHQTYPLDPISLDNLADIDHGLGKCEKALRELQELLRTDPNFLDPYYRLFSTYLCLNRVDEAEAALKQAEQRKFGSDALRAACRYKLAFLKRDAVEMRRSIAAAASSAEPGAADLISVQSDTEAYYGHLAKARDFSRRAADSARHQAADVRAPLWLTTAALREAEFGNADAARKGAAAALVMDSGPAVEALAALALARAGDAARAERLANDLSKYFPVNTMLQGYWLPAIRAATELAHKNPHRSIELLRPAASYELGQLNLLEQGMMYPVYLRGQAYLLTRQGREAAAEFQKLLDHSGIVLNFPLGALAHLQLGRAYALQGDTAKARAAYQDFLTLWKDADPDIPVLIAAKSEYAKLN